MSNKKNLFPETKNIPFDLHYSEIKQIDKKDTPENAQYMELYKSKGVILDFYKKNSTILDIY